MLPILFQALSRDQVVAVHIDNGFMRKNESHQVEESLKRLGVKLKGKSAEEIRFEFLGTMSKDLMRRLYK